jgi:hypothetical protein
MVQEARRGFSYADKVAMVPQKTVNLKLNCCEEINLSTSGHAVRKRTINARVSHRFGLVDISASQKSLKWYLERVGH